MCNGARVVKAYKNVGATPIWQAVVVTMVEGKQLNFWNAD